MFRESERLVYPRWKIGEGISPPFPFPWNDAAQETNKREMAGGGLALK